MSQIIADTLKLIADNQDVILSAVRLAATNKETTMATLKISDLSVGDLVRWNAEYGKPQIVRVTEIHWNCIVGECKGVECAMRPSNIEPIPITAEILDKNGFRKNGEYNEWNIGEWNERPFIGVSIDRQSMRVKYFGNDIFIENKVVYVHQLQHALRLAGVEKEINL